MPFNLSSSRLYHQLADLLEQNLYPFALITLVETKGSSPLQTGAKMLVSAESVLTASPLAGTIGGGALEAYAIKFVHQHINQMDHKTARSQTINLNLKKDLNMECGGTVSLLFEFFIPTDNWNIVVFGAGHVSQALIPLLCRLNATIYCQDDRAEWLDKLQPAPNLIKYHISGWLESLSLLPEKAFFICLTHSHQIDFSISKALYLTKQVDYLGVIGSKTKSIKLLSQLKEAQIPEQKLATLYCPIGSIPSSHTAFEIAIAICAQLLEKRV